MSALLSYLPLFVLSVFWIRARPVRTNGQAFLHWILGVALLRPIPDLASLFLHPTTGPLAAAPILLSGAGAVLLSRALWYLVHVDRKSDRRLFWFRILLVIAVALSLATPGSAVPAALLAIPLLCSFRWRLGLGAGHLLLANFLGVATVLLKSIHFGNSSEAMRAHLAGTVRYASFLSALSWIYALFSLPMTGSRIHLSIRNIGRRLIGSHLLASLIPFGLAVIFLLVSGALFLSTNRSLTCARLLRETSKTVQASLSQHLTTNAPPPARPFGAEATRQAVCWRNGAGEVRSTGELPLVPVDSILAIREPSADTPLLWDGEHLWLRARIDRDRPNTNAVAPGDLAAEIVRIDALAQVDSLWMTRISRTAGEAVRLFPGISVTTRRGGLQVDTGNDVVLRDDTSGSDSTAARRATRSIGPRRRPGWRIPGGATVHCLYWSDEGWTRRPFPIASWAGFGEQLGSLFTSPRENPFSIAVIIALGVIAILFIGTLGIVGGMVMDMGRSITRAVQALTEGTRALQAGHLNHRIAVQGNDELWRVADSFNEMAEGLERIRTMEMAQQRLEEELRLARAIQTRLLPAAPPKSERIELAGLSLPAREVGGDYYDYLQLEDGRIGLAVADVSGKGTPAALLMSAFRAALRSQDLGRLGPAEALGRINRFIHESVDPGKFITAFLALIDPQTGDVRYANAGHDAPIVVQVDGTTAELTGGGLILGMLPQIVYEEAQSRLEPGDLLVVYTDGVTEARSEAGDFFGPERLVELLRRFGTGPCSAILQQLVEEIERFAGEGPQADDITVILARRK